MKSFSTNEAFFELFKEQSCSQKEMGHRIESDKHSVSDWLKNKNELKFSNLEKITEKLNKKITIKIE